MAEIRIDQEICIRCGACIDMCSVTHVYGLVDEKTKALSPSRCWECGQCVAVCPVDAIMHSSFPLDECPVIERSDDDLEKLIGFLRERRSNRVYKEKHVERKVVDALVRTTRWAPTGKNLQAISWLAVDDPKTIALLSKKTVEVLVNGAEQLRSSITSEIDPQERKFHLMQAKTFEHLGRRAEKGEEPIFFGAPVVLAAVTPRSHFGRDDAVISGYTLQLAAVQMGLGACQIGYFIAGLEFDPDLGRDILDIPDEQVIQIVLTLGYPRHIMRRMVARNPLPFRWIDN